MKRELVAAASLAALFATPALAQPGPGMMRGYGPGPGWGMGPWMMDEYGPGYGMGPGMMGTYGHGMWGYGPAYGLDLNDEQRAKVADIRRDVARKHFAIMEKIHEQSGASAGGTAPGAFDEQAARQMFEATQEARKEMFETWLDARKRMEAVLTPEQRERLQQRWGAPARR